MTGPSTDGDETVETRAVKTALARLASAGERPDPTDAPAAVVAEAAAATRRLEDAAAFVRADGRERLSTAVERLHAADRTVTADRGDAVLAALSAVRAAADDETATGTESASETTSAPVAERI